MTTVPTIPRTIRIYYERGICRLNFAKINGFIERNFGRVKVSVIRAKKRIIHTKGLLFDFVNTQESFKAKAAEDSCHIVLTDRIFATLSEDKRPHIRASIYSVPSVISTSGIVEGPAKPKEFYIYKQRYGSLGVWDVNERKIKRKFKGKFIDYGDRRLTEVIKGYIAQAIFFYITGEPFCDKRSCRLYNAHWQKDLVYSQIEKGRFCKKHEGILNRIRTSLRGGPKGIPRPSLRVPTKSGRSNLNDGLGTGSAISK